MHVHDKLETDKKFKHLVEKADLRNLRFAMTRGSEYEVPNISIVSLKTLFSIKDNYCSE